MSNIQLYTPSAKDLTPEQIAALRPTFDELDADHNGKINIEETKKFMEDIQINPIFAKLVFELCDTDKDGQITFEEFGPYFKLLHDLDQDPSCIYRTIFEKYDTDHNGKLDKEEVRNMLKLFSDAEWTDDNIEVFIDNYDLDKDGFLDLNEVCKMIKKDS